jgi:membrane protease YdiL (CAAX protease family)
MAASRRVWCFVPLPVRAIILGMTAAALGTIPWAWLATENLKHLPSVPWGPVAMAGYLWLYWRYATGHGWPASTAGARRDAARARPVDDSLWGPAIVAGFFGIWCSLAVLHLIGRVVAIPAEPPPDVSHVPALSLMAFALMTGLVAGVVEEVSFRGYMQHPLEKRYGPVVAIVLVGVFFGAAHASHTYWSLALLPYYMAIAAVFGGLAFLTGSIVPSLVLHAGADALDALLSVAGAGSVEMAGAARSGGSAGFGVALNVVILIGTGIATVWAFRELARAARERDRGVAPAGG